jgi:murein L,D-transpeptidase YcbB/YkuD
VTAATVAFGILNHRPSLPATYEVAHFETRIFQQELRSPFADRWLQAEIADQIDESRSETTEPLTRAVRTVRFARPVNVQSSEASVTFAPAGMESEFDEVEQYLWEVYQREPVKKDGSGDFTWKDQAAAKRMSMSLQRYVISGMDPDFREQLYHAGRAMDADGLKWCILSAFRDDYRQSIAAGPKAGTKNSRHGGSLRTGGYGHGQAIDVTGTEGTTMDQVWRWLDERGGKYGLHRPMPGYDPAHVQSRRDWRKVAQNLRKQRNQLVQHERDEAAKVTLASLGRD